MAGQPRERIERLAEYTPGHVECQSCGYTGHPMLGDGTGANCAACGSYSVRKTQREDRVNPAPAYPNNSVNVTQRNLAQPGHAASRRTAAVPNEDRDVNDLSGHCASGDHDECEDYPDTQCLCQCHDHHGVPEKYREGWEDTQYHQAPFDRSSGPHPGHLASRKTAAGEDTPFSPDCPQCVNENPELYGASREEYARSGRSYADERCPHRDYYQAAKTATVQHVRAEMLNPGDMIRLPNGKTQKVTRVRPHETSQKHVYIDTDGGTAPSRRDLNVEVVPQNSMQQAFPDSGTPGGNSNSLPFGAHPTGGSAPATQCPQCQGKGTMSRRGDHFACSRCGYSAQYNGGGSLQFSDRHSQPMVASKYVTHTSTTSAVARRAAALLNREEDQ